MTTIFDGLRKLLSPELQSDWDKFSPRLKDDLRVIYTRFGEDTFLSEAADAARIERERKLKGTP